MVWVARAGGAWALGSVGATWVVRWTEWAATGKDKFLRDGTTVNVSGGVRVPDRHSWGEVRITICIVRNITEAPRTLPMAIGWARRGAITS